MSILTVLWVIVLTIIVTGILGELGVWKTIGGWAFRRLLRLDEWWNYNIMNGRKRETISTRTWRAMLRKELGTPQRGDWKWYALNWILNIIDKDHCKEAYDKALRLGKLDDPVV